MRSPRGDLVLALALALALSGCTGGAAAARHASPVGHVSGQVLFVGGPAPGLPHHLQKGGTVVFTGRQSLRAWVHPDGHFSLRLSPGTYQVTATSPAYLSGRGTCEARHRIRVTDGRNRPVKIFCQLR